MGLPGPGAAPDRRGARPRRRARRARAVGAGAVERLADGQVFDGMESWLPWLSDREHLLPDLLPDDALVLLVEPKRTRDRQELLDEEAALGSTLSATRPPAVSSRACHCRSTGCSRTRRRGRPRSSPPESPDTPLLAGTGFDPVVGDTEGLRRLRDLRDSGARRARRRRGGHGGAPPTCSPAKASPRSAA